MDSGLQKDIRDLIDIVADLHRNNRFDDNPNLAPFYLGIAIGLLSRTLPAAQPPERTSRSTPEPTDTFERRSLDAPDPEQPRKKYDWYRKDE
jgi:hypothetical protein